MARGIEGNELSTPRPSASKKQAPSSQSKKNQKSILGFFQKKSDAGSSPITKSSPPAASPASTIRAPISKKISAGYDSSAALTPAPSSDAPEPSSPVYSESDDGKGKNKENEVAGVSMSSPIRKGKKAVNYAESDDDDVFHPISSNATGRRASKRRKVSLEDSDDEFGFDAATEDAMLEGDMDDFIVPDDSDEEAIVPQKRRRQPEPQPRKKSIQLPTRPPPADDEDEDDEMPTVSTAQQWTYDPENLEPLKPRSTAVPQKKTKADKGKQKAHVTEPDQRYPWLANILDADRNPPGHPDYDPRTIYIPPLAWNKFSPFEKQYWEIKQKFWDTIVFFKKGKFYELYENDATIGHQLFDLKLTDRVNMRMVGVPEASLDQWANQFVAKGFKIARVDQMESALAKEMRERDGKKPGKPQKEEKIIRRELAAVLTAGTLVDGGMLQDDMSTFCVAIKEIEQDNLPTFGIAFVDTATAQFHLCQFVDDIDMTKFETFVAQTRPGELLLEKSCISAKALRILKNNTSPTTLWNYLKPAKEFWSADITCREIDASDYFVSPDRDNIEAWPSVLREARDKELVMSAFGALLQYLRMLKIERDLVTLGNFSWYDPIDRKSVV